MTSYPWYPMTWRNSEAVLAMTAEQRDVYRNLLDMCWIEGSLPLDEKVLKKLSLADDAEWRRSWPVVRQQFEEADGRLRHWVVDAKRPKLEQAQLADSKKQKAVSEARKAAGEAGAKRRWRCGKPDGKPMANAWQTDGKADSKPDDNGCGKNKQTGVSPIPIPIPKHSSSTSCSQSVSPLPPADTDPDPASISDTELRARRMAAAAPPHRRDSIEAIVQALIDHPVADDDATAERYRGWCASEEWRRDDGRYAVSPAAWIRTGRYLREPPAGAGDRLDPVTRRAVEMLEARSRKAGAQ